MEKDIALKLSGYIENDKNKKSGTFSIWCFNRMWIEKTYKSFLPDSILKLYNEIDQFGKDVKIQEAVLNYVPDHKKKGSNYKEIFKSVISMTPFYMNERLDRQKGSFLLPTNPYVSFEENLFNMVQNKEDIFNIIKINTEYTDKTLLYLLKMLDEMNNNSTVLFNNTEGLCQQINFKSRLPNDALTTN